jgi:O-antigen/teichoic acid export membrane protein
MGIVFRQSVKNLIVVAVGAILGALIIWLSTKYINKQELGFIRSLTNNVVLSAQILLMGLSSTLFVYSHKLEGQPLKRRLLLTLCLGVPAFFALLFTVAYFVFKQFILHHYQHDDIPYMTRYYFWMPVFTFLFIYMIILEQYLGSQMKVAASAFMREIVLRVVSIILILLFAFNRISFDFLIAGTVLVYLIPLTMFVILCLKTEDFGFSLSFSVFTRDEYKDLIHFTWYHFLLNVVLVAISLIDVVSLPFYDHSGFQSVAIYSVALFMISFLLMPSKAFLPASFADLSKCFAVNDMGKARNIFTRASINLLIPSVAIALVLCCNLENIVAVVGNGKNYSDVTAVFLILMLGSLVNVSTGMNDQVLSIANYYKFNFYVSLVLIVIQLTIIKLYVPRYGVYAAAWSNTIVLIIFNIIKYIFIKRKLAMDPYTPKTLLVMLAAVPALAAGYFFPYLFDHARHIYIHTLLDMAVRSAVIILVFGLMILWLKPSPDLEEYVASVRKNKRLF